MASVAERLSAGAVVNAEKFYNKVLQFPKSGVYAYALYKKGWVYLNQDRNQDALETFFKALLAISAPPAVGSTISLMARTTSTRALYIPPFSTTLLLRTEIGRLPSSVDGSASSLLIECPRRRAR